MGINPATRHEFAKQRPGASGVQLLPAEAPHQPDDAKAYAEPLLGVRSLFQNLLTQGVCRGADGSDLVPDALTKGQFGQLRRELLQR